LRDNRGATNAVIKSSTHTATMIPTNAMPQGYPGPPAIKRAGSPAAAGVD
jgi:hypothetical protein